MTNIRRHYNIPNDSRRKKYSSPPRLSVNDNAYGSRKSYSKQKYSNPQRSLIPRLNDQFGFIVKSKNEEEERMRRYLYGLDDDDSDDDFVDEKTSDKTKAREIIVEAKSFADMKSAELSELKKKLSEIQELIDRENLDNKLKQEIFVVRKNVGNAILYQETINSVADELRRDENFKETNSTTLENLLSVLKNLPNKVENQNFIDLIEKEIKTRGGNTFVSRNESERLDKDAFTAQESAILAFLKTEEGIKDVITKDQLKELERLMGVVKGNLKLKEVPEFKELMTVTLQKIKGEDGKPNLSIDKLKKLKIIDGRKRKRKSHSKRHSLKVKRSKRHYDGKKRRSRRKSHSKKKSVKRSRSKRHSDGKKRRSRRKSRSLKKSTRKVRQSRRR